MKIFELGTTADGLPKASVPVELTAWPIYGPVTIGIITTKTILTP